MALAGSSAQIRVLLFGATGMVGQGVLRECLLDPDVELVVAVGRTPTGQRDAKLREIVVSDLFALTAFESQLSGYVTTTEQIGRAMLAVAKRGFPKRTLETADINRS